MPSYKVDPWMAREERATAVRLAIECRTPTADDVNYYRRKLRHREDVAAVASANPALGRLLAESGGREIRGEMLRAKAAREIYRDTSAEGEAADKP